MGRGPRRGEHPARPGREGRAEQARLTAELDALEAQVHAKETELVATQMALQEAQEQAARQAAALRSAERKVARQGAAPSPDRGLLRHRR
ncbi:MAG: hypothetical protein R2746_08810 [Acidimicrobiales bacterium]